MANLNDLPPITYTTERFAICEWAERVLVRTHESQAEFLGFGLAAAGSVLDRLYRYADANHNHADLLFAIGIFEADVHLSDVDSLGQITVPMESAINLAKRVMEHACH